MKTAVEITCGVLLILGPPWALVFWNQRRYWRARGRALDLAFEADKLRIDLGHEPNFVKNFDAYMRAKP